MIEKLKLKIAQLDSKKYVKYLTKRGCKIGEYTHFHDPRNTFVDYGKLPFIEIGQKCQITRGVTILAHDFSYSVLRNVYHDFPQKSGKTIIGNNVFIGMNSIILLGANIGDNVIIGAGSVVSGKVQSNSVYAGNPAKFICTLEEYYSKCKNRFEDNAVNHARVIKEFKCGINPTIEEMGFFSLLFLEKNESNKKYLKELCYPSDNYEELINDMMNYSNKYKDIEDFMKSNSI